MDVHGARIKDNAALADNPHRFSRYDGDSTRSVMNQHHFTSDLPSTAAHPLPRGPSPPHNPPPTTLRRPSTWRRRREIQRAKRHPAPQLKQSKKQAQAPSLHLQRNSPKEHIGADMQEFGKLVWTKSPTRLRRCGYEEIPLTSELADKWWEEKDWKASHRLAERFRTWCAHRRFHHNPEDARKSPQPTI